MSDFKTEIVRITIMSHPNADRLEIARVGDYQSLVGKGVYQDGDLVAYIQEGSLVPEEILEEMNLTGRLAGSDKNRVKAVRLRGVLSQGICYPAREGWVEGQDVSEELGITKYVPPTPTSMRGELYNGGGRRTVRYDIENIKRYPDVLKEGEEVVITEKIHGCADRDTVISTLEHGDMTIGEVVDRKLECHVLAHDLTSQEDVYSKVEGWSREPNTGDWYELELEDGSTVILTGNHPVYLPSLGVYRRVEDLEEGLDVRLSKKVHG